MKPEEPSNEDCCHNGCTPCVFDIYEEKLKKWIQSGSKLEPRKDLLSQTCFKPFKLTKIKKLTPDTNLYTFTAEGPVLIKPGQHLVLKDKKQNSYTVIQNEGSNFDIAIKLYEKSQDKNLKIDSMIYWRGPYGDFNYVRNTHKYLVMISMGTGIAPMYAISKQIVSDDDDNTRIDFIHGCKSPSDIILRDELSKLASFWNFNCVFYLSQNCDLNDQKHNEKFVKGRITEDSLKIFYERLDTMYLICGSDTFCSSIKDYLKHENIFVF